MFWLSGNFFWIFILAISLAGIVSGLVRSHQREKTIRTAIEKGVALDPATLSGLQARAIQTPQQARAGLITGAIVTFATGCGLAGMGYFLNDDSGGQTLHAFLAIGALLWCIGLGLAVAAFAVRRN